MMNEKYLYDAMEQLEKFFWECDRGTYSDPGSEREFFLQGVRVRNEIYDLLTAVRERKG